VFTYDSFYLKAKSHSLVRSMQALTNKKFPLRLENKKDKQVKCKLIFEILKRTFMYETLCKVLACTADVHRTRVTAVSFPHQKCKLCVLNHIQMIIINAFIYYTLNDFCLYFSKCQYLRGWILKSTDASMYI